MSDKSPQVCLHRNLHFGSGSYYIFCHECRHTWVCSPKTQDAYDPCLCGSRTTNLPSVKDWSVNAEVLQTHTDSVAEAMKPWANQIASRFGHPVWLVGSSLVEGWKARDVDVRVILPDEEFERRFGIHHSWYQVSCWRPEYADRLQRLWDEVAKLSRQGASAMLINLDFTIQPATHAERYISKPRLRLDSLNLDDTTPGGVRPCS